MKIVLIFYQPLISPGSFSVTREKLIVMHDNRPLARSDFQKKKIRPDLRCLTLIKKYLLGADLSFSPHLSTSLAHPFKLKFSPTPPFTFFSTY